jgi:gliding motility-associated-like protein
MKLTSKILAAFACLFISVSFAQRGKDGSPTISTVKIVNEYTTLASDVIGFPSSITVAAATNTLNANGRFTGPLAPGDLIMIIQMQGISVNGDTIQGSGGTIYGTPVDNTWGEITNYNNCGNYEFAEVKSVPSDGITINLDCALQHDYSIAGRVQVIRVPRYSSLIVAAGGSITCPAWVTTTATKGTGGLVAIEVQGNTQINNANGITVSSLGFRGGSIVGDNSSGTGGGQVARSDKLEGAEKGEGIFGYQADYDKIGGRYCRGVAGNAGGGGNMHNAAGGGGANAGNINTWDGEGNPDASVAGWITAWNREVIPSFATHTSSGGGRGGYSFASVNRDATLEGPRPFGSSATNNWGGDFRTNNGGWGGRPLDYSTGRLFMGGGGGAGDQDNNQAGDGGKGAGLIYFMNYGTVSGTGSITANGAAGVNSGIDGAGGGGGGGTVIINSVGAISGISISANGGVGGNQVIPAFTTVQSEGPGGGGGGGYIAISNGTITQTVNGGANGTTDSPHLTEFLPNGATKGGSGLANQSITNFTIASSGVSICSGNTATLTATLSGAVPAGTTITWWDAQVGGSVVGSGPGFTTPVLSSNTTYYVGTCPGTYRIPVVVTITAGPTASNAGSPQTVCGATATLAGNTPASGTGTWSLISGAGTITTPSSPTSGITALGAGPNVFQWTISLAGCSSSSSQVTITGVTPPTASNAGSPQTVCGTTTTLAGNTPASGTGLWTLISGSGTITTPSSATSGITGLAAGANVFQWTISNPPCTASSSQVTINVSIPPTTSVAGGPQTVCGTTATLAGNTPAMGSGIWTLISGAGTITTPSSPSSGITALGAGANVFQWSITNGSCPASTSQVTITGVTPPTISAAGSPQTVCGTTTTLAGNTPASGTGVWTLISGSGTITTPSSATSGITGLAAGANVFQWTISNPPCTASSSQVTINVSIPPTTSVAGGPQTICGTTATLAGNTPAIGSGIWTLISGAGNITIPASPTSGITSLGAGPNVFEWSITNGSCPASTSQVTITGVTPPTASVAGSPQTVCGTTTTLAGNVPASGTGLWTLVSGSGSITTPSSATSGVTGLGAGANVFQWTISNGSCASSSSQVTITTGATADATITQPSSVCLAASSFNLSAATSGGTWSGTGITNSTNGTFDPSIAGIGTDTITYAFTGSCSSMDTVVITVISTSNSTIVQPSNVCVGAVPFNLSAATPGGTWSGTGIINSTNGTFDPSVAGIGTDTISYSISGSCGSMDTVVVTITSTSDATITQPPSVCSGASPFDLSAATPGGTWSGPGIINSAVGTFDPSVVGVGTDTIRYNISGSCGGTDTVIVTVNATANATITQPGSVCPATAPFNLSAATPGGTWSGIGITNSVNGTFDPSITGVGNDTIKYTITGNCGSFDTVVIKVNPPSNATINNVLPVCQSALPFNLSAATTGGTWSGTGITNSANGTFDPAIGAGIYTITYTISGACGNSDIQSVTVNALPSPGINASSTIGCAPLCVQFSETASTLCNTLNYQFGDGNSSTASSPLHCYNQAGVYSVSITCNDNNSCSGTTTINNMINVLPTPVANFSVSPSGIVGTNTAITVTDLSTAGGNQAWNFGDPLSSNNTSSLSSDSHSYATEGDFCIQLVSTNIGGCADTTSNCIVVANDATLSIPNVFTPNGDGNNDVFNVSSTGLKTLSINIYDRWGIKITELNSINGGWDGRTTGGKVSTDGVYYYILKATSVNDKNIEKEGFVQLLSN